jgi:lysophospholipase L1-like esterase
MTISTRLRRTIVATAVAVLTLAATVPAHADAGEPEATHWYLAIGDSVSAGLQPGTGVDRSGAFTGGVLAHLQQTAPKTRLRNLACEVTETSPELIAGGDCTYEEGSQLAQGLVFLRAHSETTDLVTITIGGNDITPCLARPTVAEIQACVAVRLNALAGNLSHILREVRAAAPHARVVVGNYYNPYIVHPTFGPLSAGLAGALNHVITQVATGYGAPVADVAGAFDSYDGDGTPSLALARATICGNTWMCTLGNIHPNDAGYRLYAGAFIARLG